MHDYIFSLEMQVRDYELDSEGIVNNANYLHYLEHTRHAFCRHAGFSFGQMQQRGIIPVLNRVEIDYKKQPVDRDAGGEIHFSPRYFQQGNGQTGRGRSGELRVS